MFPWQNNPNNEGMYPYIKVTGCLSLPKDIANYELIWFFFKMSHLIGSCKVYNYFVGGYHQPQKIIFSFFLKLKLKMGRGPNFPIPTSSAPRVLQGRIF